MENKKSSSRERREKKQQHLNREQQRIIYAKMATRKLSHNEINKLKIIIEVVRFVARKIYLCHCCHCTLCAL